MNAPATASEQDLSNLPRVAGVKKPSRVTSGFVPAAVSGAALGMGAIVIGWAITEAAGLATGSSLGPVAVYTAIIGAVYGLITSSWSDLVTRIWDRAIIRACIGAFVGAAAGALAGALFQVLFNELQAADDPGAIRFYLLRSLSWAVFGVGIGAAAGIAERSVRKTTNGIIGGLVGGLIGGAIFHWLSLNVDSASNARLAGLSAIGIVVGAAIGVVEVARRQAWVRVTAGGMAGKEFILYHATTQVGSSPKCELTLIKDANVEPFHLRIDDQSGRRLLTAYDGAEVSVNDVAVRSRTLRNGDRIRVGGTTLEYLERDHETAGT